MKTSIKKPDQANVLFVSDNFPPVVGGSATVYHYMCKYNQDMVVALTSRFTYLSEEKQGADDYDRDCGFRIYRRAFLRAVKRKATKFGFLDKALSVFDEVRLAFSIMLQISVICRRHKINAVCVGELIYGGWIVLFAKYILRKQVAIYTHGEEVSQESTSAFAQLRKRFLTEADIIFAVSHFCKSQIVSKYNIDPGKIRLVPNGVDLERFSLGEKKTSLLSALGLEKKKIVLAAGRHVERKGFDHLITSFGTVRENVPDVHLLIVGDGPLTDQLRKMTEDLELSDCVTFLGRVNDEDLVEYYRLADVFTMPNRTLPDGDTEGFGLVFLEANACGTPVVGGIGGGAIEAIIDGETGFNVDASDPSNIARALTRLFQEPGLIETLGTQGQKHTQNYSWAACADIFRTEIDSLLLDPKASNSEIPAIQTGKPATIKETGSGEINFFITVDFEESFDWAQTSQSDSSVGGLEGVLEFHEKCKRRKIRPTYLVTFDILNWDQAVEFLQNAVAKNECELGLHLHAWNTPPHFEELNEFNTFQCNLPSHLEREKLETLARRYQDLFGQPPICHRAGRYGIDDDSYETLSKIGIKIDLSPMSGFSYNHLGGPSFSELSNRPFWNGPENKIFCFPLPSERFFKGPDVISNIAHRFLPTGLRMKNRNILGISRSPVRLTPEDNSVSRMKIIAETLIASNQTEVVVSLHSTSLYVGGNPYSNTKEAVSATFANFEDFVDWCINEKNMKPTTPSEIFEKYAL